MANLTPRRDAGTRAFAEAEPTGMMPGKTFKLLIDRKEVKGIVSKEYEQMVQLVYKFVNTEQGEYLIYPSFGLRKRDVFHRPKTYAYNVLKARIEKGLLLDDRVTAVDGFYYDRPNSKRHDLAMSFTVHTIYNFTIDWTGVIRLA